MDSEVGEGSTVSTIKTCSKAWKLWIEKKNAAVGICIDSVSVSHILFNRLSNRRKR